VHVRLRRGDHDHQPRSDSDRGPLNLTIWTLGHGNLAAGAFLDILRGVGIGTLGDVRRFPGSRRQPQFGGFAMERWLADADIAYRWFEGLGGRRQPAMDSPNMTLRNPQFRAYADHMASAEFGRCVADLVDVASTSPTVVMCAESVWWRCHRRLLADHLVLVEDVEVVHIFHDARLAEHPVTPGARREAQHVMYDAPVETRPPGLW
jgi:uncharacterized protein (DUF488 family)